MVMIQSSKAHFTVEVPGESWGEPLVLNISSRGRQRGRKYDENLMVRCSGVVHEVCPGLADELICFCFICLALGISIAMEFHHERERLKFILGGYLF